MKSSVCSAKSLQPEETWFITAGRSGGPGLQNPDIHELLYGLLRCIRAQPTAPLDGEISNICFFVSEGGEFFDFADGVGRCRYFKQDRSLIVNIGFSVATLTLPVSDFCQKLADVYLQATQAAVAHAESKKLHWDVDTFRFRMESAVKAFLRGDVPPKPSSDRIRAQRPAVVRFVGAESFGIRDSLGDFWPQVFAYAQSDETKLFVVPDFVAKGLVEPMLHDAGPSICIAHDRSTYIAWPCSRVSKKDAGTIQGVFKNWQEFWFMVSHAIADMYWVESVVVLNETLEALPEAAIARSAAKDATARYVEAGCFSVAD